MTNMQGIKESYYIGYIGINCHMGMTELGWLCVNCMKSGDPTSKKICPCVPIEVLTLRC